MVGATSGIGEALSHVMARHGSFVIAVGRRQERLDAFVKQYGPSKAASYSFDVTKMPNISAFAQQVIRDHPDLDFIAFNSGIQRGFNFAEPETVDLDLARLELDTNYTSCLLMSCAFLPHLKQRAEHGPAAICFTTSGLAMSPISRCPNYCASKAAMHAWILCLRHQLKSLPSKVKVIELIPPAVQTELHDKKHQPDIEHGRAMGMPLDEFTDKAWTGLMQGKEQIPIGTAEMFFAPEGAETKRQMVFERMNPLPQ